MNIATFSLGILIGASLGAALVWLWLRNQNTMRLTALQTERELLHARVQDLESSASADQQTANVLLPLQQTLTQVQRQVSVLERDRVEQYGELGAQLRHVAAATADLGTHTAGLSGALRASTTTGMWGEAQLRRVLEHSGMLPYCDFEEQVRATTETAAIRPDVVIRMPGDRNVVVDAKAPVGSFLDAQNESLSADERTELLRRHAAALSRHVDGLAAKSYWRAFEQTPELVLCFVPADAVLSSALRAEPAMFDRAAARNVVLVSPSTLLAALRTMALVWQQESVSRNAQELLALGQSLYERLGTLGKHTADMGTALRRTVERYNALVGSLENRVMVTARSMHELGVSAQQPPELKVVDAAPRPLTARELIDALDEDVSRPQLPLEPDSTTAQKNQRRSG